MARDMNQVTMLGNVGHDARGGLSKNGHDYIGFSLAVQKGKKDKDGQWTYTTNWFSVVAFGAMAKHLNSKGVHKGDRMFVTGELQENKYTNKDGIEVKQVQILATGAEKIDKSHREQADQSFPSDDVQKFPKDEDSIPF